MKGTIEDMTRAIQDPAAMMSTRAIAGERSRGMAAMLAAIGEVEPAPGAADEDLSLLHLKRVKALRMLAPHTPVITPKDAAVTLSLAADALADAKDFEWSEAERERQLHQVHLMLGQLGLWMRDRLCAPPFRFPWMQDAACYVASPDEAGPDAALIALCEQYDEAHVAYAERNKEDGDEYEQALARLEAQLDPLHATTLEGVLAKVKVAKRKAQEAGGGFNFGCENVWMESILSDLAAIGERRA